MKLFLFFFALTITGVYAQTSSTDDVAQVRQACFNYIDTFYKVDTTLAYQNIHPTLQKRGFYFDEKTTAYSKQLEMPFPALIRVAKNWNKDGKHAGPQSPREVSVFEVADKTASAKVTAEWGIDYIHLIKENGRWMIVNVLWQSPPKSVQAMK
ncbi:nuclear transport factor 2 family protein [Spirosoma sp. BT702]|uniref:Nuclear transport factor 2 family protein n=1 Tax=Spirosoma profusum TaxID=2771354 RepID=A0A927AVK4_9BACT|nr:nuclear transport factor 2 family protein [Spirosoma profusum]MBD2705225.1 nuclear transport factor 2 family protein [Spirosoma profusum]